MELKTSLERYGRMATGMWLALAVTICLAGNRASAQDQKAEADAAGKTGDLQQGDLITLPAGTVISVRLADTVDSNKNHIGDQFSGTIDPSVLIGDHVVIPRGTEAHLRMLDEKKGGHIHGHAEVKLALTSLVINGTKVDVESNVYRQKKGMLSAKVKGEGNADAKAAGNAASDAASGTTSPLEAGGPIVAAFRAADVRKPAGTKIDFTLIEPFTFERPSGETKP